MLLACVASQRIFLQDLVVSRYWRRPAIQPRRKLTACVTGVDASFAHWLRFEARFNRNVPTKAANNNHVSECFGFEGSQRYRRGHNSTGAQAHYQRANG